MSTRSCIMLKVRKEDIGKVMKFDNTKVKVLNWDESTSKINKEVCAKVELNSYYIGIYCHWDGYPSYVGKVLKKAFNSYDKALNLILGGDASSIDCDYIKHYSNRGSEEWKWLKPKQDNTQNGVIRRIDCEYAYLFDEERGGWLYKHTIGCGANKSGFKKF